MKYAIDQEVLENMRTNQSDTVWQLSFEHPVLLVFLRHFGCTFCREALSDIAKLRPRIETTGTVIVFVHMTDGAAAEKYFQRYDLPNAVHVSDPDCHFYADFGLTKGTFNQLFGLQSLIRGFEVGVIKGNGMNFHQQLGDGFQMPGVFVIHEGQIKDAFVHKLSHDRPDYEQLVNNCCKIS